MAFKPYPTKALDVNMNEMGSIRMIKLDEKTYRKNADPGNGGPSYDDWVHEQTRDFEAAKKEATEIFLYYLDRLRRTEGDRPMIEPIRDEIRNDEKFIRNGEMIEQLAGEVVIWTHAILRSEARRTGRSRNELLEKRRLEREEEARRLREEEAQQLAANPIFGMFG